MPLNRSRSLMARAAKGAHGSWIPLLCALSVEAYYQEPPSKDLVAACQVALSKCGRKSLQRHVPTLRLDGIPKAGIVGQRHAFLNRLCGSHAMGVSCPQLA